MGNFRAPDDVVNDYIECAWRSCNRKPQWHFQGHMREILLAEGIVKIGTTTHLKRRLVELRANRYYKERGMNYIAAR